MLKRHKAIPCVFGLLSLTWGIQCFGADRTEAPVEVPQRSWQVSTDTSPSEAGENGATRERLSNSSDEEPAPLTLPRRSPATPYPRTGFSWQPPVLTTIGSLSAVCGLFLALAYLWRRYTPSRYLPLPKEVFWSLGTAAIPPRHTVHLLQLGSKLVLVACCQGQIETITEITDPEEVARLRGLCEQQRSGSISASFRQLLSQVDSPSSFTLPTAPKR